MPLPSTNSQILSKDIRNGIDNSNTKATFRGISINNVLSITATFCLFHTITSMIIVGNIEYLTELDMLLSFVDVPKRKWMKIVI